MEDRKIRCRNCGNYIKVPEGALRIQCNYCGAKYALSSQKRENQNRQKQNIQLIDYMGRGALFKAYIPSGWSYRVIEDNSISSLAAVCKGLQLSSGDGAELLFLPFAYYKDYGQRNSVLPGRKSKDYQLDPFSLVCYRRLTDIKQYAFERIAMIGKTTQVQLAEVSCEILRKKTEKFWREAEQKLNAPVLVNPGKFHFRFWKNGMIYEGIFATIIARTDKTKQTGRDDIMDALKKGMAIMGAMYGIGGIATFDWGRAFDLMLIYPQTDGKNYEAMFDRFIEEFEYGFLYYALQDEELHNTQQIQRTGAMQRQQNAIRASQNLSRTLSETSDIVNQGCWEHSQQMDRIYDKYSEAVRGVNTYTDSTGKEYEADISYDHVYRRGDSYVGSKDGSLELGPDWEELKRK